MICSEAISSKIELVKRLEDVLQGSVKPSAYLGPFATRTPANVRLVITQCCIQELYMQGIDLQPTVELAKTFERRKCNHREAIPGDECLLSVVGACSFRLCFLRLIKICL